MHGQKNIKLYETESGWERTSRHNV